MKVVVSSSLEGRDLALLKSVLNILHSNDIVDSGTYSWLYQEDTAQHHIYIAQDFHTHGVEYYALIKEKSRKIALGPSINPKNLRHFFEQVESTSFGLADDLAQEPVQRPKEPLDNRSKMLQTILSFTKSASDNHLLIESSALKIVIDKQANLIRSDKALSFALISSLLNLPAQINEVACNEGRVIADSLDYECPATHFLWRIGMAAGDVFIDRAMADDNVSYKLVAWPDYGSLEFEDDFISISAIVWRRAESFHSLTHYQKFQTKNIIKFLNATSLAGYVTISRGAPEESIKPLKMKDDEPESFMSRLKRKLFGMNNSPENH